ncbi:Ubx domain-containing protein [Metarhizium acridum]|nr:Ubx domain-containing protein [Metarhizium acridum]
MADLNDDVEQLSTTQQEALQQYIQVTNQDPKEAISLLQRSQWNVQIAIAKFFDGEGPDPVAEAMAAQNVPRMTARHENLQESLLAEGFTPRSQPRQRTDAATENRTSAADNTSLAMASGPSSRPVWLGLARSLNTFQDVLVHSVLPAGVNPTPFGDEPHVVWVQGHERPSNADAAGYGRTIQSANSMKSTAKTASPSSRAGWPRRMM